MCKFSVIVPTFNGAERITKGLNSISLQVFTDYELIVICDSCTDNTVDISRQYTDKVEIVNYHAPGPTRNKGLDIATGEYILFMDDNDWWLHEFAFKQINDYLTDEDILCFGFIWKYRGYTSPNRLKNRYYPAVWNKCWKRIAIGDTKFPSVHPEDVYFHNQMMKKNLKIKTWDMPLYYYNYWHEGSISYQKEKDLRIYK